MKLARLLLLLVSISPGTVMAQVYQWQDEAGQVHFGDDPPEGVDARALSTPDSPSEQDAERTREHLRQMGEIYDRGSDTGDNQESIESAAAPEAAPPLQYPDCFSRLSDLVQGPQADIHRPLSPSQLDTGGQADLAKLLRRISGRWQGTMHELSCHKGSLEAPARILIFHMRTSANWDPKISRLTLDSDSVADASRIKETLLQYFEVGEALYFFDWRDGRPGNDNRDLRKPGNRVELLSHSADQLSFLLKRRQRNISRSEVRQLELRGNAFIMTEQYFYSAELTGARLWVLQR